eukprot:gene297-319_t
MMIYRMLCFLAGLASLWQGEAFVKTIPKTSFQRVPSTLYHTQQNHFFDLPTTKKVLQSFLGALMITAFTVPTTPWPAVADARLNAPSAAGTRVNSDPESLLRYGLPIDNKEIRDIQAAVESARMNLKTRRDAYAMSDVNKARSLLNKYDTKILNDVPAEHKDAAKDTIAQIKEDFSPLIAAISAESSAGPGSVQERKGLDDAFAAQERLARDIGVLEEALVPDSFRREVPVDFSDLPYLTRRATVELTLKKPDGSKYDVEGRLFDKIKLQLVVDGFNAPLTSGNFVDLVHKGFYNGKPINRADGFVVQAGDADPNGEVHGYIPPGSKTERKIPLEISLRGDPEILYAISSEDDGRGAAATSLPFQAYGALGMARSEDDANSASTQFFFLLFQSDLTPAGKNMLDGRFTCFGYTTSGQDLLSDVREGDIIESAKVVDGLQYLRQAADGK